MGFLARLFFNSYVLVRVKPETKLKNRKLKIPKPFGQGTREKRDETTGKKSYLLTLQNCFCGWTQVKYRGLTGTPIA
jgi:hypothetical protein